MTNQELEDLLSGLGSTPQPTPNPDRIAERFDCVDVRLRRMHIGIGVLLCYTVFTAPFFLLFAACIIRDIQAGTRRPAATEMKSKSQETTKLFPAPSDSATTLSTK